MLSKRFPFGIYYEVEDDVVYVYAILDLRRDPLWITDDKPVPRATVLTKARVITVLAVVVVVLSRRSICLRGFRC